MRPAIRVDGLGKEYRLGGRGEQSYKTLREAIMETGAGVWGRIRHPWGKDARGGKGEERRGRSATFWALENVSFEIGHGEVIGVIGRNGAGKSTLLKVLSRITEPTRGRVEMRGRVGSLLEVGTGFHPELTGRENIYLNGSILGMSRREIARKFDEIVAFAEIERFLETPVKRYSSGMYVRLAFAVAAHLEPEILVVDEVLAVGDAAFQKKCLGKMSEVSRHGRTILFVSHNIAAVESLCERGLLLEEGRLVADGPATSVLREYMQRLQGPVKGFKAAGGAGLSAFSFQSVEILRDGRERTQTLQPGDPVTIRVMMEARRAHKGLYLGVAILDDLGRVVSAFHAKETGMLLDKEVSGKIQLDVDIPKLLLLPGQFHLRLVAVQRGGPCLQEIPSALTFEVLPKDFSGHGHCFGQVHGSCLMPFRMRATCNGDVWAGEVLTGGAG